jgi:hypothetical protein
MSKDIEQMRQPQKYTKEEMEQRQAMVMPHNPTTVEDVVEEFKDYHAGLLSGRLSPLYLDEKLRQALQSQAEEYEREKREIADTAEMLWVVLANVSEGNWEKQTPEWQEAAARWRDNYFKTTAQNHGVDTQSLK